MDEIIEQLKKVSDQLEIHIKHGVQYKKPDNVKRCQATRMLLQWAISELLAVK